MRTLKLCICLLIVLSFVGMVSASFTFQGYTKYINGTNMSNVNISIDVLQSSPGGPPTTIGTVQNVSNSNAYFSITINNTYANQDYMYQPSIIKYNSVNGLAEFVGQSIPSLMYDEMISFENSPITFYLKPAITVDLSGIGIEHGIQNNIIVSDVSFPSNYSTGLEVVNESNVQLWAYINASDCLYLLNSTYSINRTLCNLNITNIQDLEYYQPDNSYYFLNTSQVEKCYANANSIICNVSYSLINNGNPMGNYTNVGGIEYVSDLNLFYISASNGNNWVDAYNVTFNRQGGDNSVNRPDFNDALPGKLIYYDGYIYEIMNQSSRDNNYNYNIWRCSIYGNKQCQDTVNFFSGEVVKGIARNEFDDKWYYASIANKSIVQLSDPWTTRFNFFYQVKDVALGYPIKETFSTGGNGVTSARFSAVAERNYSIMFYPNNGPAFPSRIDLNGLAAGNSIYLGDRNATIANNPLYVNLSNANLTLQFVRVPGFAKFDSNLAQQNYTDFSVTAYLLEAGNMVFKGATLPQNMGAWNWPQVYDVFNTTSGFYNMTLPATVLGSNLMLFATASKNNSGTMVYYGGFKTIILTYGQVPSQTNISLYPLIGQASNLTVGFEGEQNAAKITTALKRFIIQDTNGTRASQAHIEVELNYPATVFNGSDIHFSWMADISDSNNGTLELPLLNYSIKNMQVFSQQYAPKKKVLSISEVQPNPVYYNLSSFQNVDPDSGGVFNDIEMMMYRSGTGCSVPLPSLSSCSLMPSEEDMNSSNFNPFSVVLGGGKIDFEMKKLSNNITVRYIDVDLLASGPPDAMFDDSANSSTSGNSMQEAWKLGSEGPSIYSYVLLGIPYNASAINESGDVRINITKFYGESWSTPDWQQGNNSLGDLAGTDYVDYNSGSYAAYINGTAILCDSSDVNLSLGLCYKDTANDLLWFKIPHFSGIGPSIVGNAVATTQNNNQNTGGGGAGSSRTKVQCNDGIDNDGDGLIDLKDPGCNSNTDNSEDSDKPCVEKWMCGSWKDCTTEGKQIRSCVDIGRCSTTTNKPITEQSCVYEEVAREEKPQIQAAAVAEQLESKPSLPEEVTVKSPTGIAWLMTKVKSDGAGLIALGAMVVIFIAAITIIITRKRY